MWLRKTLFGVGVSVASLIGGTPHAKADLILRNNTNCPIAAAVACRAGNGTFRVIGWYALKSGEVRNGWRGDCSLNDLWVYGVNPPTGTEWTRNEASFLTHTRMKFAITQSLDGTALDIQLPAGLYCPAYMIGALLF